MVILGSKGHIKVKVAMTSHSGTAGVSAGKLLCTFRTRRDGSSWEISVACMAYNLVAKNYQRSLLDVISLNVIVIVVDISFLA